MCGRIGNPGNEPVDDKFRTCSVMEPVARQFFDSKRRDGGKRVKGSAQEKDETDMNVTDFD